jgi:hypothetical protein
MNLRAAAQQALEALEYYEHRGIDWCYADKEAITALRTALAEPEQEPVAWGVFEDRNLHDPCFTRKDAEELARLKGTHAVVQPLYTHPPQRKPLTEEEIVDLWAGVSMDYDDQISIIEMARAIERAHGIGGEA